MSLQQTTRRTALRGAGVSMALPWLESVRIFGQDTGNRSGRRRSAAFCGALFGKWIPQRSLVGPGNRPRHGTGPRP
jgi:hypothetical protein